MGFVPSHVVSNAFELFPKMAVNFVANKERKISYLRVTRLVPAAAASRRSTTLSSDNQRCLDGLRDLMIASLFRGRGKSSACWRVREKTRSLDRLLTRAAQ
jgi:hypothetical protein